MITLLLIASFLGTWFFFRKTVTLRRKLIDESLHATPIASLSEKAIVLIQLKESIDLMPAGPARYQELKRWRKQVEDYFASQINANSPSNVVLLERFRKL